MTKLSGAAEQEAIGWLEAAGKVAQQALCHRAKCGTVIVKDGQIIGSGYNAPPLDKEEDCLCDQILGPGKANYDQTCCVHAEWRAIMDALKRNPDKITGAKLYFTRVDETGELKRSGQPFCTVCSRLALDTGLAQFILWHEDGVAEYPTDEYNRLSYSYRPV